MTSTIKWATYTYMSLHSSIHVTDQVLYPYKRKKERKKEGKEEKKAKL